MTVNIIGGTNTKKPSMEGPTVKLPELGLKVKIYNNSNTTMEGKENLKNLYHFKNEYSFTKNRNTETIIKLTIKNMEPVNKRSLQL